MAARKKRSPDTGPAELVQTRISYAAKLSLEGKAEASAISVAAYVRRLLYRDLGIIKGDSNG